MKIYGSDYIEDWVGKKVALFVASVSAFGDTVDAIRIRNFVPREVVKEVLICEDCGQEIKSSNGLDANSVAQYTLKKYGKKLCSECAARLKENGGNQ